MIRFIWYCLFSVSLLTFCRAYYPYEDIIEVLNQYPLPSLNFGYNELEPHIDGKTVQVHHGGHHRAYTNKMNAALKEWRASGEESALSRKSILEILKSIEDVPNQWKTTIRNNGGGYLNHAIYFSLLSPNPERKSRLPFGTVLRRIEKAFGNFSEFRDMFTKSALTLFGSGYVWLCRERKHDVLTFFPTVNQESPVSYGLEPILVIDVWEHAYYLKHQNKRGSYVEDWWNVVDWEIVNKLYDFWNKSKPHEEL